MTMLQSKTYYQPNVVIVIWSHISLWTPVFALVAVKTWCAPDDKRHSVILLYNSLELFLFGFFPKNIFLLNTLIYYTIPQFTKQSSMLPMHNLWSKMKSVCTSKNEINDTANCKQDGDNNHQIQMSSQSFGWLECSRDCMTCYKAQSCTIEDTEIFQGDIEMQPSHLSRSRDQRMETESASLILTMTN